MDAISVYDLHKTYTGFLGRGRQEALQGLTLQVERGTAFGLVGPNGAGKTTFIKALLGIVRPTSGLIEVLGDSPESVRVRQRIGYLPERLELPPFLTPLAFLASVARLKKLLPEGREIETLLVRVGLDKDRHRKIGGFSKGMRQRLGLAAALMGHPELLVLDEPTDGVDPLGRVEIRNLLAVELHRGCTILLNSHLLAETERICQRVGILASGKIVLQGPLDELCRADNRWRLKFDDSSNAVELLAAGFTPSQAGTQLFSGAAFELNIALDKARASGALLLSLKADDRTLEEVLAAAVAKSQATT